MSKVIASIYFFILSCFTFVAILFLHYSNFVVPVTLWDVYSPSKLVLVQLLYEFRGILFLICIRRAESAIFFLFRGEQNTANCMEGNHPCCAGEREPHKISPKAIEEIIDQQTQGYKNLQEYSIKERMPKEDFEICECLNQDDDSLGLHFASKQTNKSPSEMNNDWTEVVKVSTTQAVYAGVAGVPVFKATKSVNEAMKAGGVGLTICNFYDSAISKKNQYIDKYYKEKPRLGEVIKQKDFKDEE